MADEKSSLKIYIVSAGIGLGAYLLAPILLSGSSSGKQDDRQEILSAVSQIVDTERKYHENAHAGIEARMNALANRVEIGQQANGFPGFSGYNEGQYAVPVQPYNRELPPVSQYPQQNVVQYPSHDIYFSWQANDRGIASSRREYHISVSTGKLMENVQKLGSWFKEMVKKN